MDLYSDQVGGKITQRELNEVLNGKIDTAINHVNNLDINTHVTPEDREKWNKAYSNVANPPIANGREPGYLSVDLYGKLMGIDEGATADQIVIQPEENKDNPFVKVNEFGKVIKVFNPSYVDIKVADSDRLGGVDAAQFLTKNQIIELIEQYLKK